MKANSKIAIDYIVIEENYITSQSDDFNETILANPNPRKYDLIIGNPPYKKIQKNAVEATSMQNICHGAPNLYFLFTAMGLFNLDTKGEMVYIIPRSWTSGAYFKKFRNFLLKEGTIERLHLFISRDKVFEKESVLQETIIIKLNKQGQKNPITITSTQSNSDYNNFTEITVPYENIVFGKENYVYLVTSEEELQILRQLSKWDDTLISLGLKMKTGLVVDFRSREYLRNETGKNIVPLFYSQHIRKGKITFPIKKENEYIITSKRSFIQDNKNYLIVKRFTAKEEKRRLQSGIYLSSYLPDYNYISTQNKVNFIDSVSNELSIELVYGLYVIFNSTIYDMYYRILNGSTQVNSTEINTMPMPPIDKIINLGKSLISENELSVGTCNKLLEGLM